MSGIKKADATKVKRLLGDLAKTHSKGRGLFKIEFEKYYHDAGKVLLKVKTETGKANFQIYAASIGDLKFYAAASKISKRIIGKLSNAVGARAEKFIEDTVRKVGIKNKSPPPDMIQFDPGTIQSVQNKSGHGIDLIAKSKPPPSPAKWYFFEGKSTLGGGEVPGLSKSQKNAENFVKKRLKTAINGIKKRRKTWIGKTKSHLSLYHDILKKIKRGDVEYRKVDVYMDNNGKLNKIDFGPWPPDS